MMADYRQIWFFVEGRDDFRFIESVISPVLQDSINDIRVIEYQRFSKKNKIYPFLHSVNATEYADYLFLKDLNSSPCVSEKKSGIYNEYRQRIEIQKIIVVVKEIESWYLAGLDDDSCHHLGIQEIQNTHTITKEEFNSFIPKKFDARADFMVEILKYFSIETAKNKNGSFHYFCSKLSI